MLRQFLNADPDTVLAEDNTRITPSCGQVEFSELLGGVSHTHPACHGALNEDGSVAVFVATFDAPINDTWPREKDIFILAGPRLNRITF